MAQDRLRRRESRLRVKWQLETKKKFAKRLAQITEGEAEEMVPESTEYFDRIFGPKNKAK